MEETTNFKIIKIKNNTKQTIEDQVVIEVPATLIVNDKELVTLLCSPNDLDQLGIGFMFTSGLITNINQIKKLTIDEEKWIIYIDLTNPEILDTLVFKRMYTSGCGKGVLFYNALDIMHKIKVVTEFKVKTDYINKLMTEFLLKSTLFVETGGVHSAAVADENGIMVFINDIGRHNAIDKIIGNMLLNKITFGNKIILTSGRISSEILFKIQKTKIPVICSKAVPTNQAVQLSLTMGITIIGRARGTTMNIYSEPDRIIL